MWTGPHQLILAAAGIFHQARPSLNSNSLISAKQPIPTVQNDNYTKFANRAFAGIKPFCRR
ncbi:hypothetical protein A3D23_04560 [candidate division WOR-1 bacterium RIFCSPHIGHO2_02_FULL_53_26]|nr:MAG: hypothetical protein A3D23_04560 [candidate division WOR-1 bacterium RIFCSPHIGHO2_02_FULL_53_26]